MDEDKREVCPFENCDLDYVNQQGVKVHLRTVKGGGFDAIHPADDPKWKELEDFLKVGVPNMSIANILRLLVEKALQRQKRKRGDRRRKRDIIVHTRMRCYRSRNNAAKK
jgi:hypothetical protein